VSTPDHKMTKAGWIPEDWEVVKASSIGKFRGGNGFPVEFQEQTLGDYPFFKVSDMNIIGNEVFMKTANNYISESVRKHLGAYAFPPKTIVFAKVGAAVFLERKKILTIASCLDNNMAGFITEPEKVDHHFIYFFLLNFLLGNLVSTSALPALNASILNGIKIPLPPLPEQIEIARILSQWDDAIRDTTQLIAAKTRLKRALMQQLLTGKLRFREFSSTQWKTYRLGELFAERVETNRLDLPLLSITANRGVVRRSDVEGKDNSSEDKRKYLRIAPGDIGYNTMRMWQGVSAVSRLEGIVSPAYTICIPSELIEANFAGYSFTGLMPRRLRRYFRGSRLC